MIHALGLYLASTLLLLAARITSAISSAVLWVGDSLERSRLYREKMRNRPRVTMAPPPRDDTRRRDV